MRITENKIELLFREIQYLPLFEEYREVFDTAEELIDFIIYTYLSFSYENDITINSIANIPTVNY